MGLEFNESGIDRTHYIGKTTIDKNTTEKSKSITAKLVRKAMLKERRNEEQNLAFSKI